MSHKRKPGYLPSGAPAHRLHSGSLDESALPAVFPAHRPRHFHIGWTPKKTVPTPLAGPVPRIYVIERDNDILLRAIMSGVHQTELEITVSEDSVHIRGRARCDEEQLKGKFDFTETYSELFFRKVELPGYVDITRANAEFDDDILEMTLPKIALAG
jgi:HSP20 family molecular chaperone IbpA